MIVIKCNTNISAKDHALLWESFVRMAETGVILLPPFCDLLNEVPDDPDVVVVRDKEPEHGHK